MNQEKEEIVANYLLMRNEMIDNLSTTFKNHTSSLNPFSNGHSHDAERYNTPDSLSSICCPIPKICCIKRSTIHKYGCMAEDKECALNMMFKVNFDDYEEDEEDEEEEIEQYFEDDPIEFD